MKLMLMKLNMIVNMVLMMRMIVITILHPSRLIESTDFASKAGELMKTGYG